MYGSYKPKRDISIAVRELKTFSPSRIRDWVRDNRTKKEERTDKRVQANVTPQSITMWFKRHPKIHEALKQEIKEEELPKEAISETIFENGFFKELPSIKQWITKLRGRNAKESTINGFLGAIKQVCKGQIPHGGIIEGWGLKHPDRLNVEDALTYISELQKRRLKSRRHRLALRNFLKAKNVKGWDEINGELEDAGKYAHLHIPKKKIYDIFEWLKARNYNAYRASKFGFKTASRIGATLSAEAKRINFEDHTIVVIEKATKGKGKRLQEKLIPNDLWEELPKEGKLFNITANKLNDLLRSAYKEVIPELADDIPMPFHFWRHQFAQHLLRETGWNYALVARLGHWTVETLERYYGKMDRKTALEAGRKYIPNI